MEHKIEGKTPGDSKEENKGKGKKREYTTGENKEELTSSSSILTTSNQRYTEEMLLDRLQVVGLLDDYLAGKKVASRTVKWLEFFPKEDILQIFAHFPEIFERCRNLMEKKLGPSILTISVFDDTFCNLFEKAIKSAKQIHINYSWAFGLDTDEYHEFEFAMSLLYTYLEEDYRLSAKQKDRSILSALDKFAESDFVNAEKFGLPSISSQLYKIIKYGNCSAGFTEQLSRVYTALTLARTIIYYHKQLEKNVMEKNEVQPCTAPAVTWNYQQSSLFFKPKNDLQQELVCPLYHGDIDTNAAKNILSNRGQYLARYSSQHKNHYLTILLDINAMGGKEVLNFMIPEEKVGVWMKNPLENRAEIEFYIEEKLINIKNHGNGIEQATVIKFLEQEQYSPIFNQVSNTDILNATPK